jgi:hypothetical protein
MADFEQKMKSSMQNVIFWKSSLLLSKSNVFGGLETPKIVKSLTTNALKTHVTKKTRLNTNVYRFLTFLVLLGSLLGSTLALFWASWPHLGATWGILACPMPLWACPMPILACPLPIWAVPNAHLGMPNAYLGMPDTHLGMPDAHLGMPKCPSWHAQCPSKTWHVQCTS